MKKITYYFIFLTLALSPYNYLTASSPLKLIAAGFFTGTIATGSAAYQANKHRYEINEFVEEYQAPKIKAILSESSAPDKKVHLKNGHEVMLQNGFSLLKTPSPFLKALSQDLSPDQQEQEQIIFRETLGESLDDLHEIPYGDNYDSAQKAFLAKSTVPQGDKVVGIAYYRWLNESEIEVNLLGIHKDFQKKGLGRELLAHIEATEQPKSIRLRSDYEAQGFYRKLGYEKNRNGYFVKHLNK